MDIVKEQPLISICIPAYNNERYIKDTIQCVIDQTYSNWELIITDDQSQDTTLEHIKTYTDPRITVRENKVNLGLTANWNKVIKEAKGEYIKLLCGDDLISPDCLEKEIEIFLSGKYPTVSLVTSYTNLIGSDGKLLMLKKYPFRRGLIAARKAIALNFLFGTNTIGEPGCGLYKRTTFSEIGEYDESNVYCVDLDFWLRILLLGDLYVIPEPLAFFRISKDAKTAKIKKEQSRFFRQFVQKIYHDKRFKINIFQCCVAYFSSSMMQLIRNSYLRFYLR